MNVDASRITARFNGSGLAMLASRPLSAGLIHRTKLVEVGGSTDEILDILRAYGGRLTWRSAPDSGQADAVNVGLCLLRYSLSAMFHKAKGGQ